MLNKIIHFSLANRLTVLILSVVILVAGTITLLRTEVDIFPDLNAPTVVVMTEAPGFAPEDVETIVTYPIETAVNGSTGVRRVRSASSTGLSTVWVEFDWGTDIYRARQIVTERIASLSEQLPSSVKTPTLGPQSSILGEMLIIGMTADSTSLLDLRTIAERLIRPRLLAMGGVSQVSVIGGDVKEYQIRLLPEKMKYFDVSLSELLESVENLNDNASGGVIYQYGNEYIIKGDVNTTNPDEIAAAVIRSDERGIVTVGDVADVGIGAARPQIGLASVKATPAVIITVTKQPAEGTIGLTERIDRELAEISRNLPSDIVMSTDIFRQSDFIDNSISNLQEALLEGALFVIIILFFFLMNLRTTLISVVALPLSIIVTVLVLHFLGYTINTMSLGGIAIAIGSLVDDAIVDVENVYKRLRHNASLPEAERKPVKEVVYHASAEVRMPIFNSSLIIIASFLPLFFLTGIEGRMLIPLGVSFIVALIASTLVALTVTPVLCSFLLGTPKQDNKLSKDPWLARKLKAGYSRSLTFSVKRPTVVVAATSVLFVVALILFFTLGRSFLPGFNEGSFTINVSTLPSVSLEESDKIGREAERIIMSIPEVRTVARKTGRAELDEHSLGVNVSEIEAPYTLTDRTRSQVVRELRAKLSELPGVNVEIGQPISHRIDAMMSGTESQIAIKLFGDDLNRLFATGNKIKSIISSVPGIVDANIEQQVERPELVISPRRELMAAYGVKMSDFNNIVAVAIGGRAVSQVYENGQPYDLTVILDPSSRATIESISEIAIDSSKGKIPLSTIAEIKSLTGPNMINRENVKRRIIISANVDGRDLRGAVNDIRDRIEAEVQLPPDYYVTYGGQFESEAAASATLMWTSLCALAIIFMLLYGEFKNWGQALLILINMPLALIGGIIILKITSGELNIPAIIGFISLMGISTRNGMLLITRFNNLAAEGENLTDRIFHG
ncbi:MAG: CusA/CzcA family heavy metal efflux RND transporter, partial [Muribaculaceae bacterium]|nr:CusA/CzcA family heavy metal efflux RND transporter [Muribaculaceae bacterium]